jgi:hypothetical protein
MNLHKITQSLMLAHRDRWFLLLAVALLAIIKATRSLLPFRAWRSVLGTADNCDTNPKILEQETIDKIVWAVSAACKNAPGELSCLHRAIAVRLLLAQYCCPSRLCMGVAHAENGSLMAHAWVECRGKVVIGNVDNLWPRVSSAPSESRSLAYRRRVLKSRLRINLDRGRRWLRHSRTRF